MPTKSKTKAKAKATKGGLNKKQLAHLEKRLHEERARVMKELGYYDESFNSSLQASDGDLSRYSFHMADQGPDAMEREQAFLFASQEGRYLWHVTQAMRGVRAVARGLLALDLLRARHRRAVRAPFHGDLGAAGRPVSAARPGARVRRSGRERDRSESQRPGRRELRGRGDRQHAVADLQRRRLCDHGRGDRARDLPLARGPGAGASEGRRGGAALMAAG